MPLLCHAFGLPVATELVIPGAASIEPDAITQPAFTVELGIASLGAGESVREGKQDGPYRLIAEGLLFEKHGVARFLCCRGGERLIVVPEPGTAEADVAAYLIATAIPALLWMRGEVMLHGAVAVLPGTGEAIAVLGPSGSGKSRLLQEIAEAGGSVAAEDSFRLWREGERFIAAGLPGLIHRRLEGAALHAERATLEVPASQQMLRAELDAVMVLETMPSADQTDEVTHEGLANAPVRLDGIASLEAILRNRHRHRVPDLLGLSAGVFPLCGALARELPVYSWEFLQAAFRCPRNGRTWRLLSGLPRGRV